MDEGTGEWIKLHNEELRNLHSTPNIIRVFKSGRMRWVGHVMHMGGIRNAYRFLVCRPERRRTIGSPRCRWEDNIKVDLREIGFGVWIGFMWLRRGTGGGLLCTW
jgi:hypothetical protein